MNGTPVRSTLLVRAALATGLAGHWAANALFDRAQYQGASTHLLDRLDDPMLVQALVGVLVITVLTVLDRCRHTTAPWRPNGLGGIAALVGCQVALFVGLEGSERLAIEALAGDEAPVEPFEVGFVAELLVAVGLSIVLAFAGEAARRCLGQPAPRAIVPDVTPAADRLTGHVPRMADLVGAGGDRAPPR